MKGVKRLEPPSTSPRQMVHQAKRINPLMMSPPGEGDQSHPTDHLGFLAVGLARGVVVVLGVYGRRAPMG
jgi:hypothetical protein